jgi:hypothetical protein
MERDLPKGDFAGFLRRLLGDNALIASVFQEAGGVKAGCFTGLRRWVG